MINKPIDQITEQDLQALVDNKMMENKTIEYKQTLPGNSETEKKEFLADVSSFANTSGGDLIHGITENPETREPQAVQGFDITNVDETKSRLENILRDGISPRISGIVIKEVILASSNKVLITRVPKSWNSHHRVVYGGHDKFYARNSNGKYPMDVVELRNAFNLSENIAERIKSFSTDRLSKILSDDTPIHLLYNHRIVLHIIPIISLVLAQRYDIDKVVANTRPKPIYCTGWNNRYNIDGFLTYSPRANDKASSYTQLYRNGIIEAVDTELLESDDGKHLIPSIAYEKELINALDEYLSLLKSLDIIPPVVILLTLLNVRNYLMGVNNRRIIQTTEPIDRDILNLPEIIVESYEEKAEQILKPCFNSIWNACGYPRDLNYNDEGKWMPHQ